MPAPPKAASYQRWSSGSRCRQPMTVPRLQCVAGQAATRGARLALQVVSPAQPQRLQASAARTVLVAWHHGHVPARSPSPLVVVHMQPRPPAQPTQNQQ